MRLAHSAQRRRHVGVHLGADDVAGFCAIYGDGSVPAECDTTPRHGFDGNCTGESTDTNRGNDGCGCATAGAPSAVAP